MAKVLTRREFIRDKNPDGTLSKNGREIDLWIWFCPACGFNHHFFGDGRWTFNGDFDRPTFSPSLLVTPAEGWKHRCHTFVQNGQIQYCGDCDHAMAGQTVEMVDI